MEIESNEVEPMKFLQRLSRENVIVKKLSSALGEPSIYVSIVYRSSEREKVLEKGKKLNAIIDAISDLMKGVEVSGR